MAAFREMAGDAGIPPQDKLALAVSGWLLDSKGATTRLSTALSLVRMRDLIRRYMTAPQQVARSAILRAFGSEEGANPALVARLLANMKPPVETPAPQGGDAQSYELEVPGQADAPPVRYLVQLPPEYDPHRRYPAVVSLHGAGMSPQQQIDWWAGPVTKGGWRAGQASRQGYIVIAPAWAAEHQKRYLFSAHEHAAVLDSLRDACRRFSIDVDRVFLSGHSTGGDAAWDIGLAHPDLWAGVIPITARSERYSVYYWENAALVPLYFVAGELDGDRMANNARDWDRYMKRNWNVTVVEYRGRGHDSFSDEVLRLFDWMGRCRRDFFPKDFKVISMRPWDNFFWWVELGRLPPQAMTDPSQWDSRRNRPRVTLDASATRTNSIRVQTGAGRVSVWLSPDLLDLGRRVTVTVNGRRAGGSQATIVPDLATMLEDARTRGDRQHPFWAKIEWPGGAATKGQ
jgi:acetyl esterase/lipase